MGAPVRPPPPLTERRPGIPPAADDVLAKALAKIPEDRYDSCLEFVAALRVATATGVPRLAEPPTGADVRPAGPGAEEPVQTPDPPAWARPVFARPSGAL